MPQLALPPRSPFPDVDCRDLHFDFCRGLALWFVFLDHVPDNSLSWLTLRDYGFSDTTEVFFFVSGYTCMIAYGTGLHGLGWPATIARAFQRAWEIYVAFLLLVLVYLALVQLLGSNNYLDETNTGPFFTNPGAAVIRTLLLQYMPVNTDVLPTFVLLHLAFPAALFLLNRAPSVALAGSILLYVAARQLGWNLPFLAAWRVVFQLAGVASAVCDWCVVCDTRRHPSKTPFAVEGGHGDCSALSGVWSRGGAKLAIPWARSPIAASDGTAALPH